jgi:biopolymer transport protein TolR
MRRARKSINQINVVPYIDVMLVLLVIFMITAPLVNPGQIDLPSVGSKLTSAPLPLRIRIDKGGRMSLDDTVAKVEIKDIDSKALVAELRTRQGGSQRPVVIAADGSTRYQDVISLIDLLQRNGIQRVGLLAQTKAQ